MPDRTVFSGALEMPCAINAPSATGINLSTMNGENAASGGDGLELEVDFVLAPSDTND